MEMCWNVELFNCLIFNSSCLNLLYFWKMTRVVPWNSDFWSGVSFLKSMLSAGKCSRMYGWTLGGTNTLWFSNMFLTAAFPRSFLFFIILSYEMESRRSLCTCIPSPTENSVLTTSLKLVSEIIMCFTCLSLLLALTMICPMFSVWLLIEFFSELFQLCVLVL